MLNFEDIGIEELKRRLMAAEAELAKRRVAGGKSTTYVDVPSGTDVEVLDDGVWKAGRVARSWRRWEAAKLYWGCTVYGSGISNGGSIDLGWGPNDNCTEIRQPDPEKVALRKKLRDVEEREAEVRRKRADLERRAEKAESDVRGLQDEIRTLRSDRAYADRLEKDRADTRRVLVGALSGNWGEATDDEIGREVARRIAAFEKLDAFRQDIARALGVSPHSANLPAIVQWVTERLGAGKVARERADAAEAELKVLKGAVSSFADLIATLEIFLGATPGKLSVPDLEAWLVEEGEARKKLIEREFALRAFREKLAKEFEYTAAASDQVILGGIVHSKFAMAADLRTINRLQVDLKKEQDEIARLRSLLDGVLELAKMKNAGRG
jgi:DNA repair exonuclease SbcCD ATPase subunit